MELSNTEAMERYAALGPDFLTWLLVRVLKSDVPPPPSEPALEVDIKGPLQFASEGGEATKVSMSGDEAPSAPEVFSALRQGKRLFRAKMLFSAYDSTWEFTLDAGTFDLKSAKLPVPAMADADEYLRLRYESILRLYHFLDEMYDQFLPLRLDPENWRDEVSSWKTLTKDLGLAPG